MPKNCPICTQPAHNKCAECKRCGYAFYARREPKRRKVSSRPCTKKTCPECGRSHACKKRLCPCGYDFYEKRSNVVSKPPPSPPPASWSPSAYESPPWSPSSSPQDFLQISPVGSPRGSFQVSPIGSPRGSFQVSPIGSPRDSLQVSPVGSPQDSSRGSPRSSYVPLLSAAKLFTHSDEPLRGLWATEPSMDDVDLAGVTSESPQPVEHLDFVKYKKDSHGELTVEI